VYQRLLSLYRCLTIPLMYNESSIMITPQSLQGTARHSRSNASTSPHHLSLSSRSSYDYYRHKKYLRCPNKRFKPNDLSSARTCEYIGYLNKLTSMTIQQSIIRDAVLKTPEMQLLKLARPTKRKVPFDNADTLKLSLRPSVRYCSTSSHTYQLHYGFRFRCNIHV